MTDDISLPQLCARAEDRERELEEKRKEYQLTDERLPGCPPLVKKMPPDEEFSFCKEFDIEFKLCRLTVIKKLKEFFTGAFKNIGDIKSVYGPCSFSEPSNLNRWRDDVLFGMQRLMSANPGVIRLCEAIPDKLKVNDEMLNPFLEGKSLNQALKRRKIFIIDYEILNGLPTEQRLVISSPVALFYQRNDDKLVPIAIQLLQKPGADNPVFLPSDPSNKWILAKMWFNVADSNYHESVTHLGFTHVVMEGVAVCTHRQIYKNHPIFKLLMPHFLYLIAINYTGIPLLIGEHGYVAKLLNVGPKGMIELIKRKYKTWRLDVEGTLPNDLKARGVDDLALLPHYYYRNDAKDLYDTIFSYVERYLNLYYTSDEEVKKDYELQNWRHELTAPLTEQGLGIQEVFGENGKFTTKEQVCFTLASIIFTCSCQHAAVNLRQYEEYGYPPNYPLNLRGRPPTNKDQIDDAELLQILPDKTTTYDTLVITSVLSTNDMNALGDFKVQYITDEEALKVVKMFRDDLARIAKKNKEKNKKKARIENYSCLDPDRVPNSISI